MFEMKMTKLLIVTPSLDVEKYKGLSKVATELIRGLKHLGIEFEVLEVYNGNYDWIKNVTSTPIKELLNKATIIHSIAPECAAALPFMFWKKSLVTWHDFIPFELKESQKHNLLVKFYTKLMWGLASHCEIVSDSSQTDSQVYKYYGKKSKIINLGVDARFKPKKVKKNKVTLGFLGSFNYRKGVDRAVKVYQLLKKKIDCRLILAGGYGISFYQKTVDFGNLEADKDVKILGVVKDEHIPLFYNSIDFNLVTSRYEGFGLPILEGQACGVPALIFRHAKIPTETKEKAVKCNDINDMAKQIMNLIDNKKLYKKISRDGIKYAKKFTWEKFTRQYLEVYGELGLE